MDARNENQGNPMVNHTVRNRDERPILECYEILGDHFSLVKLRQERSAPLWQLLIYPQKGSRVGNLVRHASLGKRHVMVKARKRTLFQLGRPCHPGEPADTKQNQPSCTRRATNLLASPRRGCCP